MFKGGAAARKGLGGRPKEQPPKRFLRHNQRLNHDVPLGGFGAPFPGFIRSLGDPGARDKTSSPNPTLLGYLAEAQPHNDSGEVEQPWQPLKSHLSFKLPDA